MIRPGARVPAVAFQATVAVAVIVGFSDLSFFAAYFGFLRLGDALYPMSHAMLSSSPRYMVMGAVVGTIFALWVASSLRRRVWRQNPTAAFGARLRQCFPPPLVLSMAVGILLVADRTRERYSLCRMMADYHAEAEVSSLDEKSAARHLQLKDWYERASIRPWMSIHPARKPPGF